MLNKAMQVMETLRNAEENRATLINEHLDALNVLGYESTPIVINKGHIVEVQTINDELVEELQMQLDMAKEELDYYHDVEKDYNNDIELFQEENVKLKEDNAKLKEENEKLKAKVEELTNAKLENIVKKHVEGDDAMEQSTKTKEDKIAEEHTKYGTRKPNPKKQPVIIDERRDGFVDGRLSLDGKTYMRFTASNRFDKLIVYGVTDEETLTKAKELLISQGYGDIFTGYVSTLDEVLYAEDKENKIVAFCEQGVFYGHIDNKYYFVYDPTRNDSNVPGGCLINNMDKRKEPNDRGLKKMNKSCWGTGFVKRAEDIIALCKTMKYIDINRIIKEEEMGVSSYAHNNTNEIIVDTNDTVTKTNDNVPMTEDEAADAL
jgi:hypothetical protein